MFDVFDLALALAPLGSYRALSSRLALVTSRLVSLRHVSSRVTSPRMAPGPNGSQVPWLPRSLASSGLQLLRSLWLRGSHDTCDHLDLGLFSPDRPLERRRLSISACISGLRRPCNVVAS